MRVRDLTDQQQTQILDHLTEIGEYYILTDTYAWFESEGDFLDASVGATMTWKDTPQGHEYWNDIVSAFRTKAYWKNVEDRQFKNK